MNKEIKNRVYVRETFEELHAPEGLRRKVMDMTKVDVKKTGMSIVKKLAVAAAMVIMLFVGSNGVVYAMTGSTLVETITAKMNINGVWKDVELEGEVLQDGTMQYSTTVDVPEGGTVEIVVISDEEADAADVLFYMDTATELSRTEIVEEDGKIYFIDDAVKIDITEDMVDGYATGSFERNGSACEYEVKAEPGVSGCYELHITSEE